MASDNLKSKLRRPLLILIVVFPLITLILFNIAVRIYVDRNARAELLGVSKMMETSVRTELARDLGDFSAIGINNAFTRLAKSLSASKLAVNTEMLLFNRQQELLYPQDESAQALSRQLIDKVSNRIPSLQEKRVYTLRDGRSKYFLLAYPLTNLARGNPTVVFISQTDKATALINTINLILIILLVLGAALAALLAERLSARIARPVVKLSELTKQIGSGHFSFPAQPAAVTDISEINMLYQSIGEMAKRLEAYDNSQKTFLQNASHELKTPLMSIQGYAEGIAGGVLPDTKQAAQIITRESIRLNTLVEELLTLSRIENQTYHKNLGDVLKEYGQRLGGLAAKLQKQLTLALPDAPVRVLADDTLLSQAVMNIASNCLRYAGYEANITLLQREGNAVIRISDDGDGVPEADLPHIFERFYKGKGGNFGLGLAIAKSATEFMGGRVTAHNGGKGAVFELIFPESNQPS